MGQTIKCPACQAAILVEAGVTSMAKCRNCGENVRITAPARVDTPGIPPAGRKRTVSFNAPPQLQRPPATGGAEPVSATTRDTAASDPHVGKTFAGYCIESRLGKGDRVDVYLAYHKDLGTPAAIKLLRPDFCRIASQEEETFLRQARQRIALQHPNVLQIHDVGHEHERYFLVTEYVDGPRLEDQLDREGALPVERAVDIAAQLCNALLLAHQNGIHPCGINPFNTLLDKTGMVKASVFGLSGMVHSESAAAFEDGSVEAAQYLAPEQADGAGCGDARSDLYALGCILYRMLCGKPPYIGTTRAGVMQQHQSAPIPDPHGVVPTLPRVISSLVAQMLAKDPAARPAGMEAVVEALAGFGAEIPPPPPTASDADSVKGVGLAKLLAKMGEMQASDLHLKVGAPPVYRIRGETRRASGPPFMNDQIQALLYEVMSPEQIATLKRKMSVDLSFTLEGLGRYRINAFRQRGYMGACVRRVNTQIPTIEEMLLPPALVQIASVKDGMVLTTGPTGSGQSTTLAILIGTINQTRRVHILTIEDPLEFVHEDKLSIVTQREIGLDTPDFLHGLRDGLRQDPDVILIGELRDMETVETALAASETGHLVLGTLHASNSIDTISRLLNFFPFDRHENLRQLLGNTMRAILAQRLVAGCQPDRTRVVAVELLLVNEVIRQCIMDGEDDRIYRQFEVFAQQGLQSFNMDLYRKVVKGFVHRDIALRESPNPKELERYLGGPAR